MAETELDRVIEKVARATCVKRGIDPDEPLPEEIRRGEGPWPYWEAFVDETRAALTALARTHALVPREASESAINAACVAEWEGVTWEAEASAYWNAMLSASDLLASLREGG